jgi:hypothetical protein
VPEPGQTDLLVAFDRVRLHNSTTRVGSRFEFRTDSAQWSYSVSIPLSIPAAGMTDRDPIVIVDAQVEEGRIGVGILDEPLQRYLGSEVDATATGRPFRIELRPSVSDTTVHLMVRNTASNGTPSRFVLRGAALEFRPRDQRVLVPRPSPEIVSRVHALPAVTGTFEILVSHSSRSWNAAQCDRRYLEGRYATPGRLDNPPPFDSLPPNAAPYHGLLSVLQLGLSPAGVAGRLLHHYESSEKIVHAAVLGDDVVVCFDAGLAVFARRPGIEPPEIDPERVVRIADPWFGGLHTVVPVDDRTCLVSSSGADAILWLDVPRREVVRRWRVPSERYGANYALDDTTWLSEHYIPNDLQLGHLNCAAPDGEGGAYFSMLGQGEIGRVDATGRCEILVGGFVGCHGVRLDRNADLLYFSDSCGGRLMRVDGRDRATVLFDAGSQWLHDAVHVKDGVFLMTLGDQNRLVLADTRAGRVLADWDFSALGGSIQFLSVVTGPS